MDAGSGRTYPKSARLFLDGNQVCFFTLSCAFFQDGMGGGKKGQSGLVNLLHLVDASGWFFWPVSKEVLVHMKTTRKVLTRGKAPSLSRST